MEESKLIPGFERYSISRSGEVFDKLKNKLIKPVVSKRYPYVSLINNQGLRKIAYLHRILMLTYRPCENSSYLEVNHINGNKFDYRLSNLEWTTSSQNSRHAVKEGLTRVASTVVVKDLETETIELFTSIKEAEKVYGSSRSWSRQRGYKLNIIPSKNKRGVFVRDIETAKVMYFTTISSCAKAFNVHRSTIEHRLFIGSERVFRNKFQFAESPDSFKEIKEENIAEVLSKGSWDRRVRAKLVDTGEELDFPSMTEAGTYLKVSVASIHNWVKSGPSFVRKTGDGNYFLIKEMSDTRPWFEGDYKLNFQRTSGFKAVIVTDTVTGEILDFDSGTEASRFFSIGLTTLNWRLKSAGSKLYEKRYLFSYKDLNQ